jgi:hypothetical protein
MSVLSNMLKPPRRETPMSTFGTRVADRRTTNFPPAAPHEMKVKTASVWRKHKAVLAILATALGTIGLLTIPAPAPAHAAPCDQFAFNGDYLVSQNNGAEVGFTAPPNSQVVGAGTGNGWIVGGGRGDLDYANVGKDSTGVTRIVFQIRWNANSVGFYRGTVAGDGSVSDGWTIDADQPAHQGTWHSITPLGCFMAPGQGGTPAQGGTKQCDGTTVPADQPCPCPQPPPQPGDWDSGLLNAVNDARTHPEKYPPLDDNTEGAKMTGCCENPLQYSKALAQTAATHNSYLAAQPDKDWIGTGDNAHRNIDGKLSADTNGPIDQAGYHSLRAENVAWGFATAAEVVQSWMQHDAHSQWGHRNNILNCELREAGAAHLAEGPWGHYWTLDFGNP